MLANSKWPASMSTHKKTPQHFQFGTDLLKCCQVAVRTCTQLSSHGLLNEESLTGSLLGSLASALPLIVEANGGSQEQPDAEIYWIPYNSGSPNNPWSEARTGADFAILFLDQKGKGRFAVFQAKHSAVSYTNGKWFINVRHITKSNMPTGKTQMMALVDSAESLLNADSSTTTASSEDRLSRLTWIHYLAYGSGTPSCTPLSAMSEAFMKEVPPEGNDNQVEFFPNEKPSLFDVFDEVDNPKSSYWHTLMKDSDFDQIKFWIEILPVGVMSDRVGWENAPKNLRNAVEAAKDIASRNKSGLRINK